MNIYIYPEIHIGNFQLNSWFWLTLPSPNLFNLIKRKLKNVMHLPQLASSTLTLAHPCYLCAYYYRIYPK